MSGTAKEPVHGEEANLLQAANTGDNIKELRKRRAKRDELADKRSLGHRLQGHDSREDSRP